MDAVVKELQVGIHTGNEIVNAVVNHIVMKDKEIKFHWTGNLPMYLSVSQMDLCTIFSNVIKNAVEAVIQINDYDIGLFASKSHISPAYSG